MHTYIHYITLHYITLHYITLHYITLHYITLHYITIHYITLHYITLHYITLHYITLHYITLHYIPTYTHTYIYIYTYIYTYICICKWSRYSKYGVLICPKWHLLSTLLVFANSLPFVKELVKWSRLHNGRMMMYMTASIVVLCAIIHVCIYIYIDIIYIYMPGNDMFLVCNFKTTQLQGNKDQTKHKTIIIVEFRTSSKNWPHKLHLDLTPFVLKLVLKVLLFHKVATRAICPTKWPLSSYGFLPYHRLNPLSRMATHGGKSSEKIGTKDEQQEKNLDNLI